MCNDIIYIMNTDHQLLVSWVKVSVIPAVHFVSLNSRANVTLYIMVIFYTRFRLEESDHAPGLPTAHCQEHIFLV